MDQFSRRTLLAGMTATGVLTTTNIAFASSTNIDLKNALDKAAGDSLKQRGCAGIQIAVMRNGGPLYSRGHGLANIETATPVTRQSIFRIGSLTKQFTAATIYLLESQGKLDTEKPVSDYLPFMTSLAGVRVSELIHHTAGLHSDESNVSSPVGPEGPRSQTALAREIAGQPKAFDFEPGSAWLYSNANYIMLGAVIEAVSGQDFATVIKSMIADPLKLGSTRVDRSDEVLPNRASGYSPTGEAVPSFLNPPFIEISDTGGAGAMRSTAEDLCVWHRKLLDGQLLDKAQLSKMLAPGKLRDGRVSGANRFSRDDDSYGDIQYAGGLLVTPPSMPNPAIRHYGFINGFSALLETYLDSGISLAILCNGDVGPASPLPVIRKALSKALGWTS